jgi:FkbM family methyltransferase
MSDEMQRVVYWQGCRYEKSSLSFLGMQGEGARCFFDIGANFGFMSYVLLSQCPLLRVYAFEPNPTLFRAMSATKERNGLSRFTPVHAGLGSETGSLPLHVSSVNSGYSTFGRHPGIVDPSLAAEPPAVPVFPFWRWLEMERVPVPEPFAWIAKIDVEGYELKVLMGMTDALERRHFKCLCVEFNRFTLSLCGHSPEDILRFMNGFGYRPHDERGHAVAGEDLRRDGNVFFMPERS